jgi:triacylglycerol lipase
MTVQLLAQQSVTPALLADFATAAYWSEDDVADWLASIGWNLRAFLSRNGTECFVAIRSVDFSPRELENLSRGLNPTLRNHAVVAFRGTEPGKLRDWITDLDSRQTRWVFGRIHAGFLRSARNVLEDLWPIVAELVAGGHALHLTGHSKGAAEATVTAARLCAANVPVAGLCTFGSPRVGDGDFAAWLDASLPFVIRRYVNNNDLVARVPLPAKWLSRLVPFGWLLPAGFRHCGRLHYITADGSIVVNPPRLQTCADRLRGRWLAGRAWWHDGLRDHAMDGYQRAMVSGEST